METSETWFYTDQGERNGPFAPDQIAAFLATGAIGAHTKVWSSDLAEWMPLYQTKLRRLMGDAAVPPPPIGSMSVPPPIPATRVTPPPFAAHARAGDRARLVDNRVVSTMLGWLLGINAAAYALVAIQLVLVPGMHRKFAFSKSLESGPMLLLAMLLALATVVLFLTWKYRATRNLFALSGAQSVSPAGAVYWYFVPVAWFWKPLEAMRNLFNGFCPGRGGDFIMNLWWGLFWTSNFLAVRQLVFAEEAAATVLQMQSYVLWDIAVSGVDTVWCIVAAALVRRISAGERRATAVASV